MAGLVNLDDILSEIHALDSEERVLLDRLFAIMEQRSVLCNILENSMTTHFGPTSEVSIDVQSTSRHSRNLPHDCPRQLSSHQPGKLAYCDTVRNGLFRQDGASAFQRCPTPTQLSVSSKTSSRRSGNVALETNGPFLDEDVGVEGTYTQMDCPYDTTWTDATPEASTWDLSSLTDHEEGSESLDDLIPMSSLQLSDAIQAELGEFMDYPSLAEVSPNPEHRRTPVEWQGPAHNSLPYQAV